jgi:four helix bundle protein
MNNVTNNYDLETRTLKFSQDLIMFLKQCPQNSLTLPLLNQCLRSGTSIGANYREANGASSKKDFFNKIFICKKEAKETLYWLELIGSSLKDESRTKTARSLWSTTHEFVLIFGKIVSKKR